MIRVAVLLVAAVLAAGPKKKPKGKPAPKELEATLLKVDAAEPVATLLKSYPKLHKHEGTHGANWDACDSKESVRYVFYEESFLPGRVASVTASKVDSILCSHDGRPLPELKLPVRTPRGIKLGASEQEITAAYGPPAEASDSPNDVRYLRYKRKLELKGEEQPLRVVLIFELRQTKLHALMLTVEPGS